MCECERCAFNAAFEENLAQVPDGVRAFFSELHEKYCMVSQDLAQANCIIEGSWPSSDEYIAAARAERAVRLAEEAAPSQSAVVIELFSSRK